MSCVDRSGEWENLATRLAPSHPPIGVWRPSTARAASRLAQPAANLRAEPGERRTDSTYEELCARSTRDEFVSCPLGTRAPRERPPDCSRVALRPSSWSNNTARTSRMTASEGVVRQTEPLRVAIIGAGGVGGWYAGELALAGHDVAVLARGDHLEAMRRDGLELRAADGVRAGASSRRRARGRARTSRIGDRGGQGVLDARHRRRHRDVSPRAARRSSRSSTASTPRTASPSSGSRAKR